MTEIFVIGDSADTGHEQTVKSILSSTYRVIYAAGSSFYDCGKGYELLFFDSPCPVIKTGESCIVLAKKEAHLPHELPSGCTVIFSADSKEQAQSVKESGAFAVDCGFSPTSTVSFSSESEDIIVITLNRSMTALSGRTIQPLELPVSKNGQDEYTLMSFTALRLLLDDLDSELGRLI